MHCWRRKRRAPEISQPVQEQTTSGRDPSKPPTLLPESQDPRCKVVVEELIVRKDLELTSPIVCVYPESAVFQVLARCCNKEGIARVQTDDGWASEVDAIDATPLIEWLPPLEAAHFTPPRQLPRMEALDVSDPPTAPDSSAATHDVRVVVDDRLDTNRLFGLESCRESGREAIPALPRKPHASGVTSHCCTDR